MMSVTQCTRVHYLMHWKGCQPVSCCASPQPFAAAYRGPSHVRCWPLQGVLRCHDPGVLPLQPSQRLTAAPAMPAVGPCRVCSAATTPACFRRSHSQRLTAAPAMPAVGPCMACFAATTPACSRCSHRGTSAQLPPQPTLGLSRMAGGGHCCRVRRRRGPLARAARTPWHIGKSYGICAGP